MIKEIQQALSAQNYDKAIQLYYSWFEREPKYFDLSVGQVNPDRATHIANAANLARRVGYLELQFVENVSLRLGAMLKTLFGLQLANFNNSLQKPNFLYIPDLPSTPFFTSSEIPLLDEWVNSLKPYKTELLNVGKHAKASYVDEFDNLPESSEWDALKEQWLSTHFIKGGEQCEAFDSLSDGLKELLTNGPLANCPPHAPEVFISVLEPGAYIPPHYGISNCKLTVHIPLLINENASLTAGNETFVWDRSNNVMVFDDSFLHSAKNEGDQVRVVLICDVWNPHLTESERSALTKFMRIFDQWKQNIGKLANLDAQLYKR